VKKYYYLVSFPRSGNTVISSIINQNPNVAITANSVVPTMMWEVHKKITGSVSFNNFNDKESYSNVMSSIIPNYYKDWKEEYIIDRSVWGSPNNYYLLQKFSPNKPKYILLVRDLPEVLASFIKWSNENKPNFLDYETSNSSVEKKCEFLMSPEFQIVQSYSAVYNIFSKKENNFILIDYKDFVKNPKSTIEKIYSFLGIKSFQHSFENLDQFSANNISYSDDVLGKNLHTIRTNKIEKQEYSVNDILSEKIIEKYSNLNFWSKNN
jgi:hypothetical protein